MPKKYDRKNLNLNCNKIYYKLSHFLMKIPPSNIIRKNSSFIIVKIITNRGVKLKPEVSLKSTSRKLHNKNWTLNIIKTITNWNVKLKFQMSSKTSSRNLDSKILNFNYDKLQIETLFN